MPDYTLTVLGPLQPKERPRVMRNGHTFTPRATSDQEYRIRRAWADTGQGMIEGPLCLTLKVERVRPAGHYLRDVDTLVGRLSAEGRRMMFPSSRPDLDNQLKIVLDALNGIAFPDDAAICRIVTEKTWALNYVSRWTVTLRRL